MELQDYIEQRLAKPMAGARGLLCASPMGSRCARQRRRSIAVHASDALRFGYCLLRGGKWVTSNSCGGLRRAVPTRCPRTIRIVPTADVRAERGRHVAGAPRDAFWKSGAGGFAPMVAVAGPGDLQIGAATGIRPDADSLPQPSRVMSAMIGSPFHARRS